MDDLTAAMNSGVTDLQRVRALRSYTWGRVFLGGLVLWVFTVLVTLVTGSSALLPTIVLGGAFLVPITYVTWLCEREQGRDLSYAIILRALLVGATLGIATTSVFESYFRGPSPFMYVGVALGAELAKLLAILYAAHGLRRRTLRTGLLLGAAVGFSFAAFETAGYALQALTNVSGLSVRDMVEAELLRSILAPIGSGLWTAIVGGVLIAATQNGRWRFTPGILFAYLGVSALHAVWDSIHSVAVMFTLLVTGTPWDLRLFSLGYIPQPTDVQIQLFTITSWIGYLFVAALGLLWLGILRRRIIATNATTTSTDVPQAPVKGREYA
ncbi:PrsW family glutamic-type intramembrane protease [Actinopolymorpha alba]|uniref:PrsW family glutamic-type intramembrane protease n=1 Tax=Actinopolymorpha alba TaxID=533267 RepID=UPI00037ABB80|nr:PrsW family glutamic-type intramembrane protease [Actinopolymorpha alba]